VASVRNFLIIMTGLACTIAQEVVCGADPVPSSDSAKGTLGLAYYASWKKSPEFLSKEFERRGLPTTSGHGIFLVEPAEGMASLGADGLSPEDIVVRINGVHLKDEDSCIKAFKTLYAGKPAKLALKRMNAERTKWELKTIEVIPTDLATLQAALDAKGKAKALEKENARQEYLARAFELGGRVITGKQIDDHNKKVTVELERAESKLPGNSLERRYIFDGLSQSGPVLLALRKGDDSGLKILMDKLTLNTTRFHLKAIAYLVDDTPAGLFLLGCDDGRALHWREAWAEAQERALTTYLAQTFTLTGGGVMTGAQIDEHNKKVDGERYAHKMADAEVKLIFTGESQFSPIVRALRKGDDKEIKAWMAGLTEQSREFDLKAVSWVVEQTPAGSCIIGCADGRGLTWREAWAEARTLVGK
jgi:hypothetical protein